MIRLKLLAENMLCYKKNMISKINKNKSNCLPVEMVGSSLA